MHLDEFAENRIKQSCNPQHELACDTQTWLPMNRAENQIGELPRGDQSGTGDIPRMAIGFILFRKSD